MLFLLLNTSICLVQGQASTEQTILSKVNWHWKDVTLTVEQSVQVRQCRSYTSLIQLHLKLVASHLIARTVNLEIGKAAKQKRLTLLNALIRYYEDSIFPLNNLTHNSTPVFVDDLGTHCAVGYLLHVSGENDLVNKISSENNLAYVGALQSYYPELSNWARTNGFSIEELSWIQPVYKFYCNPDIMPGETIHLTCSGVCTGSFYPDLTGIKLPPETFLSWGNTYERINGQWVEVPFPDCLCPGYYKQEFEVQSLEGDSLYVIIFETEILAADPMYGYAGLTGAAAFCQAYVEPEAGGGEPPYIFDVQDMDGTSYGLGPLCEGDYYLIIEDANGCIAQEPIQVYTPDEDCQSFCVTDIQMSDSIPGHLIITIYLEGDSSIFINHSYIAGVRDANGNTIATGSLNSSGQFGGTSQDHIVETNLDSLPSNFIGLLDLEFNSSFCTLPFPCLATSIMEPPQLFMSIYPNPMTSHTTLHLEEPFSNAKLMIYDIQGQKVQSMNLPGSSPYTLNREDLPRGQYFIQVLADGKLAIGRITVID